MRNRILAVQHVTGSKDEVLILGERHPGVLRVRVRRHLRADPARLVSVDPLPEEI